MIRLITPTEVPAMARRISYRDTITMLGSCFADEMYSKMKSLYFKVMSNPFGTLYNPASIAGAISRLDNPVPFTMQDTVPIGGGIGAWGSFFHHSDMGKVSREVFLECANGELSLASKHFRDSNVCVITFGTAWTYTLRATGSIVANCLRHGRDEFERSLLSQQEIVNNWEKILESHHDKYWIFTVSPIRHLRDGAHANNISKAILLLAVEELCASHGNAGYFPAYEIQMDELRDYRFYADDLVHPSDAAVAHIWDKFAECALSPDEEGLLKEAMAISKAVSHRPLFPDLEQSKAFCSGCRERERNFIKIINELK